MADSWDRTNGCDGDNSGNGLLTMHDQKHDSTIKNIREAGDNENRKRFDKNNLSRNVG